ncbi:MAG: right-handed parallel beta-helix repeat-containing protein [Deltaproteobacteria bacterium]|nr:right-handed parallel beta-helix repeat-containing protein [Deltaproteobacteria bacterium]
MTRTAIFRLASSCVVALAASLACEAHAATYYVATTGNDSTGTGSTNAPWKTIGRASGELVAGDILEVRAGTYTEQVSLDNGGSAASPVTVRAAAGATVVIAGRRTTTPHLPTTADQALVQITDDYITFSGFEVRDSWGHGIVVDNANGVKVLDCRVHDNGGEGIMFTAAAAAPIASGTIQGNTVYQNVQSNAAHATNPPLHGITLDYANNVQVLNNTVYQNHHTGLYVNTSAGAVLRGNTIYDNVHHNLYVDHATGASIAQNRVYCTTGAGYDFQGHRANGIAVEDGSTSTGHTVMNNLVRNCANNFSWINSGDAGTGMKNVVVANNTLVHAELLGMFIDTGAHSGSSIVNNLVLQTATVGDTIDVSTPATGIGFSHNNWRGGVNPVASPDPPVNPATDVTADCGLANPSTPDAASFRLGASSPCVNRGTASARVTTDYFGTARPQGPAYDIGAHEVVGAVTPDARVADAAPKKDAAIARDGAVKKDGGVKTDGGPAKDAAAPSEGGLVGDGAATRDGAPTGDGATPTDGAPAGDGQPAGDGGTSEIFGCHCRVGAEPSSAWAGLGALALALALASRARRRRQK